MTMDLIHSQHLIKVPLKGNLLKVQYKKLCQLKDKVPINPIGYCFDSAAFQMLLTTDPPGDLRLCHGIGIVNTPWAAGKLMAHAWVETMGTAYDTVWGETCRSREYREALQLKHVIKYTRDGTLRLWKQTNMPGPWDSRIKKVCPS